MSVFLPQIFKTKSAGDLWIRSAVPKDAERVLTFLRQVSRESGHFFLSNTEEFDRLSLEDEEKWIESHMTNSYFLALIAEREDGVVVSLTNCMNGPRQRNSHIATLGISILREYHRQGLGQKKMEIIANWARQTNKIEKLELQVDPANTAAVRLYEKLGYQHEAHFKKQIKHGPDNYSDTLTMGLWL